MDFPFPVVNILPYTSFHYCSKREKLEKDRSVDERFARRQANYSGEGMRTTVEGILVHHNRTLIILLLKIRTFYKLPGGRLRPGENEIEGLKRKLKSKLGCTLPQYQPDWQIGECVATWWKPNFDPRRCVDRVPEEPKECMRLFIVHLAEGKPIARPVNFYLVYVPFFHVSEHPEYYGDMIPRIPDQLLSQMWFNFFLGF